MLLVGQARCARGAVQEAGSVGRWLEAVDSGAHGVRHSLFVVWLIGSLFLRRSSEMSTRGGQDKEVRTEILRAAYLHPPRKLVCSKPEIPYPVKHGGHNASAAKTPVRL
jgi:hypothetical protein